MRIFKLAWIIILLLAAVSPAVALEGPDENEPNDSRRDATLIRGLEFSGEVGRGRDTDDWFELDGQEGTNPNIALYYDERECDIDLEVYSDRELVGSLTDTSGEDQGQFDVEGRCFLHVWAYDGRGEYEISIEPDRHDRNRSHGDCEGPDEQESNDEKHVADSIDDLDIEGYACRGDVDWYYLNGQEGTHPSITLEYENRESDIDLEVYSDDELVGSLTGTSGSETGDFEVPGTCYLKVYAYDGEGEYKVAIEPGEGRHRRGSDCEGPDEREPNDDMRSATSIGGLTIDGYACSDDEDWFVLEGQEGDYATITLTHESGCDIDLEVFSDDTSVGSLTGTSESDSGTFEIPGMGYIRVYPYDGEGAYTIEIEPQRGERHHERPADCEGPDEVEPNDTMDEAVSINANEIIRGYACENDEDWFVIEGWVGDTSTLTIHRDEREGGEIEALFFDADGKMYIKVFAVRGEGQYSIELE
jgi:hypothetical protein